MVDYPVNYNKHTLVEMLVNYIVDGGDIENWERCDLGEWLAIEIDENVKTFRFSDKEYKALIKNLDKWIKDTYGDEIQDAINEHIKEAEDDLKERLALTSALY